MNAEMEVIGKLKHFVRLMQMHLIMNVFTEIVSPSATLFYLGIVPELGALPSYKCTDDRSRKDKIKGKMKKDEDGLIVGTVCEQGGKCEVQWRGQKVCGNIDTVVMSCMKHSISAPVRLCEAEEEGCVCT